MGVEKYKRNTAGMALVEQVRKLLSSNVGSATVYIGTNTGKRFRVIRADSTGVYTIDGNRIPSEDIASVDRG